MCTQENLIPFEGKISQNIEMRMKRQEKKSKAEMIVIIFLLIIDGMWDEKDIQHDMYWMLVFACQMISKQQQHIDLSSCLCDSESDMRGNYRFWCWIKMKYESWGFKLRKSYVSIKVITPQSLISDGKLHHLSIARGEYRITLKFIESFHLQRYLEITVRWHRAKIL